MTGRAERQPGTLAQCVAHESGVQALDLSQQSQWLEAVVPGVLPQCSIAMPESAAAAPTAAATGETASAKLIHMANMTRKPITMMRCSSSSKMGRTAKIVNQ